MKSEIRQKKSKMPNFEWDENKNKANQEKHDISFEDASKIFEDANRVQYIVKRGNEKRFVTVGKVIKLIVTVVYAVRQKAFRIISARQARKKEIHDYLDNKLKQREDE